MLPRITQTNFARVQEAKSLDCPGSFHPGDWLTSGAYQATTQLPTHWAWFSSHFALSSSSSICQAAGEGGSGGGSSLRASPIMLTQPKLRVFLGLCGKQAT